MFPLQQPKPDDKHIQVILYHQTLWLDLARNFPQEQYFEGKQFMQETKTPFSTGKCKFVTEFWFFHWKISRFPRPPSGESTQEPYSSISRTLWIVGLPRFPSCCNPAPRLYHHPSTPTPNVSGAILEHLTFLSNLEGNLFSRNTHFLHRIEIPALLKSLIRCSSVKQE